MNSVWQVFLQRSQFGHFASGKNSSAVSARINFTNSCARLLQKRFDENVTNEDRANFNNEVSGAIVKKNPGFTTSDYAEQLFVSPRTISRHLKLNGKVIKNGIKWVPHELNENHKRKHFETSSALLLCNQNNPFLNRIVICDDK